MLNATVDLVEASLCLGALCFGVLATIASTRSMRSAKLLFRSSKDCWSAM